jgi:hypothetical protein
MSKSNRPQTSKAMLKSLESWSGEPLGGASELTWPLASDLDCRCRGGRRRFGAESNRMKVERKRG